MPTKPTGSAIATTSAARTGALAASGLVPAGDIENLVVHQVGQRTGATWDGPSPSRERILELVRRITVYRDSIEIALSDSQEPVAIPASLIRCSGERRIATPVENYPAPRRDPALIKLIVRAHQAQRALANPGNESLDEAAASFGLSQQYFCVLVRLAYLAPDITSAILDGRQPAHLNRQFLARIHNLPIDWASQREMLGFA